MQMHIIRGVLATLPIAGVASASPLTTRFTETSTVPYPFKSYTCGGYVPADKNSITTLSAEITSTLWAGEQQCHRVAYLKNSAIYLGNNNQHPIDLLAQDVKHYINLFLDNCSGCDRQPNGEFGKVVSCDGWDVVVGFGNCALDQFTDRPTVLMGYGAAAGALNKTLAWYAYR